MSDIPLNASDIPAYLSEVADALPRTGLYGQGAPVAEGVRSPTSCVASSSEERRRRDPSHAPLAEAPVSSPFARSAIISLSDSQIEASPALPTTPSVRATAGGDCFDARRCR